MKAEVFQNKKLAGILEKSEDGFRFIYDSDYLLSNQPAISFSFPKSQIEFRSNQLFSFFSGLLSEGINKEIQCKSLKIDENDEFSRLLLTAQNDTIGAITIKPV